MGRPHNKTVEAAHHIRSDEAPAVRIKSALGRKRPSIIYSSKLPDCQVWVLLRTSLLREIISHTVDTIVFLVASALVLGFLRLEDEILRYRWYIFPII